MEFCQKLLVKEFQTQTYKTVHLPLVGSINEYILENKSSFNK